MDLDKCYAYPGVLNVCVCVCGVIEFAQRPTYYCAVQWVICNACMYYVYVIHASRTDFCWKSCQSWSKWITVQHRRNTMTEKDVISF